MPNPTTVKEKIAAAKAQLDATIKKLAADGLTPEDEIAIAKARAAFQTFKKSLEDKRAAKAAATGGTADSELKLPAFFPKLTVSPNGSIAYKQTFDAPLHKKISNQKTFPICPGLRLGGEVSLESKASFELAIKGAYKTNPANLPKNAWSSYEVVSSMAAKITCTGAFELVLTDSLLLLAAKFGVAAELTFNNKQVDIVNIFSGGAMTIDVFTLNCFLRGSLGAGETLNEIYELIEGKSCPNFLEWTGKKYTLLRVGVTVKATDKGFDAKDYTIGIHEGGVKALTDDLTAVYDDAKAMLNRLQPMVINVAFAAFPMAGFAYWTYKLLGQLYTYITADDYGFEKNKDIYIDACKGVVKHMMEQESKDPKKLKELAKIARNKNALKARYEEHMKKAKNIQIIKDIYDNLHKNTQQGVHNAIVGRDQVLTKVDLIYAGIYRVDDTGSNYRVYFKVRVVTDGPVVIPQVLATITCNSTVLAREHQDDADEYDGPTNQVYDGYYIDFPKSKLTEALGGKTLADSKWMLSLHADYAGHFKDVDHDYDISSDIKKHI
jgi:hypothetical protein